MYKIVLSCNYSIPNPTNRQITRIGNPGNWATPVLDGYVLAVPKNKLGEYRKMAQLAGKVWRKYGALQYVESVADDLTSEFSGIKFPKTVEAKPSELVIFAFVVFKSRAHRDKVNAKVMKDKPMPFDMKRMPYGGFKTLVDL